MGMKIGLFKLDVVKARLVLRPITR